MSRLGTACRSNGLKTGFVSALLRVSQKRIKMSQDGIDGFRSSPNTESMVYQLNITQTDRVKDWVAVWKSSQKSPSAVVKTSKG